MFAKLQTQWMRRGEKVLAAALAVLLIVSQVTAASGCRKIKGKFSLQPLPAANCSSPVGICAAGSFSGDLVGASLFVASSVAASVDTPTTGVIFVTGDTVFTTKSGTLSTKDAISLSTTGAGDFAEVDTVVGGSGDWAGYSGTFTATGTYLSDSGGQGTYSGLLCAP